MEILEVTFDKRSSTSEQFFDTAASCKTAQENFQQLTGEMASLAEIPIQYDQPMSSEIAPELELMSLALNHKSRMKELDELKESVFPSLPVIADVSDNACDVEDQVDEMLSHNEYDRLKTLMLKVIKSACVGNMDEIAPHRDQLKKLCLEGCQCKLHQKSRTTPMEVEDPLLVLLEDIIDSPETVTDFFGIRIMKALNYFLEKLGHKLDIIPVSSGSPYSIEFQVTASAPRARITRQKKTTKFCFRGYPDFIVKNSSRRRPLGRRARNSLKAVGEVQSKPGIANVEGSVAQARIYATGHLFQSNATKVVTIVVTKKKCGLVLATSRNGNAVNHKRVGSCDPIPLTQPEELKRFLFITSACLKWQRLP